MAKMMTVSGAQVSKGTAVEVYGVNWEVHDLWIEMGYVNLTRTEVGRLCVEYKVFENYSREKLERLVRQGDAWIF